MADAVMTRLRGQAFGEHRQPALDLLGPVSSVRGVQPYRGRHVPVQQQPVDPQRVSGQGCAVGSGDLREKLGRVTAVTEDRHSERQPPGRGQLPGQQPARIITQPSDHGLPPAALVIVQKLVTEITRRFVASQRQHLHMGCPVHAPRQRLVLLAPGSHGYRRALSGAHPCVQLGYQRARPPRNAGRVHFIQPVHYRQHPPVAYQPRRPSQRHAETLR